ncbi:MAG: GNAT family N-acetyltransferase [Alphaproteobacteria bacterium]
MTVGRSPAEAPPPVLETARLRLRPPAPEDAAAIAAIADDLEVARWLTRMPHPYGIADARFFLSDVVPAEWCWLIAGKDDGRAMGVIGLRPEGDEVGSSSEPSAVELGYWLGRASWGQGFATEAGAAVLAWAETALRPAAFVAGRYAENARSGRVLAKLGFVETGRSTRESRALGRRLPYVDLRRAPGQPILRPIV